MHQGPSKFTASELASATERTRRRVAGIVSDARNLLSDPQREQRLAAGLCVFCFYSSRIGGAAITYRPCACCLVEQGYGSTSTDALCAPCARAHNLCKRCMADVALNPDRARWPDGPQPAPPLAPTTRLKGRAKARRCPLPPALAAPYHRRQSPSTEIHMFAQKLLAKTLNQRLPAFPRPDCAQPGCNGKLQEPKPFHVEQQGAPGVLTAHCLGVCAKCGAKHKGERQVGLGKVTRALEQSFHLYTDEDATLVRSLLPKFQNNAEKLAQIQGMPVRD